MKEKEEIKTYSKSYIKNIFRIILIATVTICFAVIITGILGYINTKESLINKAKAQDLVFIVKSMASKVDSRIGRDVETSYIFSKDPVNIEWVKNGEKDKEYEKIIGNKIDNIANSYDYNNFFIADVQNKHYYRANTKNAGYSEKYIVI